MLHYNTDGSVLTPRKGMDTTEIIKSGVIADRYEILGLMGRGGMSVVYKARHQLMNRVVAIKMLHSRLLNDPASGKRFQKESQAASTLSHANLITVFDFGIIAGGIPYLVMDFVEGRSLSDILDEDANLEWQRALPLFSQVCSGLAHAHNKGVLHRDLKPSNIMLTLVEGQELVKVVDFGIATFLPESGQQLEKLTAVGEFCGTASYMSPEHCRGKELDARSDVYSMGCVMYETLIGLPPFLGDNILDTMQKQIGEAAVNFQSVRPDLQIPPELEGIVFRALEKDKDRRYQNFDDLKKDLVALQQKRSGVVSEHAKPVRTRPLEDMTTVAAAPVLDVLPGDATGASQREDNPAATGASVHSGIDGGAASACQSAASQGSPRLKDQNWQSQPASEQAQSGQLKTVASEQAHSGQLQSVAGQAPSGQLQAHEGPGAQHAAQSQSQTQPMQVAQEGERRRSSFPIGGDVIVVLLVLGACIVLPMLRGADTPRGDNIPRSPAETLLASQTGGLSNHILHPAGGAKTAETGDDAEWKKLNAEAEKVFNEGLYEEAEKLYRKASEAAKKFGENDRRYVMSLRRVADTYYIRGKDAEAARLDHSVERMQQGHGAGTHGDGNKQGVPGGIRESGSNAPGAATQSAAGSDASTSTSTSELAQVGEQAQSPSRQSTPDRLAELAKECHKHGQCDTAEQLLVRSIDMAEDVFGNASPQAEARRKDLATFYMTMGQYDKAQPLLSKVMSRKPKPKS